MFDRISQDYVFKRNMGVHSDCKNFKNCKKDGLKVGKFVHSFIKTLLKAKVCFKTFENT